MVLESLLIHAGKKKIPTTPYTKINLKSIKDLNVFEKYWKKYIIKGKNFLNKTHTKKNYLEFLFNKLYH